MRSKIIHLLFFILFWSLAVTNSTENVVQDSLTSNDYGVMLVSTIDGYLTAIDAHTGLVKWRSKEGPVLESPINVQYDFTFIPNPRDGQLYLLGGGKINKLPFTIPELVRVSPCRSTDGILYAGSKKDVWIAIDPETGHRVETLAAPSSDNFCPVSHPKTVFIGRTEYQVSMMDANKRARRWNATYSDYSSHLLPVDHNYPFQHLTSSSDGRIVTVDALTGKTLWKREFSSIIVNLYLLKPDGMHKLPSTTVGKETLEALLEETNQLKELHWADGLLHSNDATAPQTKDFFPTLYIGETKTCLYAMPAMVNEKTITIAPKYLGPPLLEGPMPINIDLSDAPRNIPTKRPILPANTELYGTTFKTVDGEFLLLGYHQVPNPITKQLIISHGSDIFAQVPIKSIGYQQEDNEKKDRCVGGNCYPHPRLGTDEDEWTFEKILSVVWQKYPGYLLATIGTVFMLLITTVWMCGRQSAVHSLSLAGISPENSRVSRGSTKRSWSLLGLGSDSSTNGSIANGWLEIGKVQFNPKEILGRGCEGTVVYKGKFDGRAAAVKRVMSELIKLVDREVDLLRESDFHPNVIRYFCSEADETFIYIALELCECSLQDYVENVNIRHGYPDLTQVDMLKQATDGVAHLHSINIVHRDLKPQNILITNVDGRGRARVLISDFGLCKKIKYGHHSISRMSGHVGTEGWMAPELILSEVSVTCAVDVFSLGCIFYYVLVEGQHPFGNNKITRQDKIIRGEYDLKELTQAGMS
uniref:non-specific serine/threonine protein kinase n=1 Tax=Acrobeloides nanus TaxID=290746 RepID=A0A914C4C2_9BILA